MGSEPDAKERKMNVMNLCKALGNVTICLKGEKDIITDGNNGE